MAVIDSLSASSGELNIALFIQNLCDSGLEFDEVVEKTLAYRDGMNTYFVLESLDTLRKNGRLSGLQAFLPQPSTSSLLWARIQEPSSSWTRPGE